MQNWHTFVEQCGEMLQSQTEDKAGAAANGREANSPVLSVFLGVEAEENSAVVDSVYKKYWYNAEALQTLTGIEYSAQNAIVKIYGMLDAKAPFRNKRRVMIAYYWDLADDRFDAMMEQVKGTVKLAGGIACTRVIFANCRLIDLNQPDLPARVSRRLTELRKWAESARVSVVLLSNHTDNGLLNEDMIWENYQIAADVVLLASSLYREGSWKLSQSDPGTQLIFQLQQGGLYSVAYNRVSRDTFGIAVITLSTILQEYRRMVRMQDAARSAISLEEKIGDGSYEKLFRHFFDERISPLLPQRSEIGFLNYLPVLSNGVQASRAPTVPRKFSLFGGFEKKKGRTDLPIKDSSQSLQRMMEENQVYQLTWRMYYEKPIQSWLHTPEGVKETRDWIRQQIGTKISYDEMKSRLAQEVQKMREMEKDHGFIKMKNIPEECQNAEAVDWYFREKSVQAAGCCLAGIMADEMEELSNNIGGFDQVLDETISLLPTMAVDESTAHAYQKLTSEILQANTEILLGGIHPGDMGQLQKQLKTIYSWLIDHKPQYRYSLKEDLEFCRQSGGVLGSSVVDECLNRPIEECRRLPMAAAPASGMKFCIVNANAGFGNSIKPEMHGEVFNVNQNDCIERLMIYPVKQQDIL